MNSGTKAMGVLFLIVGLAFAGLGIWVQFFRNSGYVETTATITQIERVSSSTRGTNHRTDTLYVAYVEYEVDGKTYSGPSDVWESGMRTGDKVTIYYNPANPAEMGGDPGWLGWFVIGIGGITALAGVAMVFRKE